MSAIVVRPSSITAIEDRIDRLNSVSAKRLIDPDTDVAGTIGDGQLVPDELLSIHGSGIELTAEQRRTLSREEVASMFDAGIRFEAVLEAGFALQVGAADDLTDPRITYLLHEMGEETRHQRLFQRVIAQIGPTARNPLAQSSLLGRLDRRVTSWVIQHPAVLYVLVLAGEEIPDLAQKLASEHPETDPFIAAVNRYHRQEEARHLSFARTVLPEIWRESSRREREVVRRIAPVAITQMFDLLVHPGVYETVGLDGWATWRAVRRIPERQNLRHLATRPVLDAAIDAGVFRRGEIPTGWRDLCSVDAHGAPVTAAADQARTLGPARSNRR